jgi:hypothetical protein
MLYICSDHGGFHLKSQILKHLVLKNVSFQDVGPFSLEPEDNYPDYVKKTIEQMNNLKKYEQLYHLTQNMLLQAKTTTIQMFCAYQQTIFL